MTNPGALQRRPAQSDAGFLAALRGTSAELSEAEELLRIVLPHGEMPSSAVLDVLPAAIYTTDAKGRITYYNEGAADLWGHRPTLGEDEWCGSWKLFWPDGTPLPHGECPMAIALREKRPVRGMEAIAERPDGSRVPFIPYPTPIFDTDGRLIGAVNMLVDLTRPREADEARERLAAIVESSDDAIVSKDLNGTIRSWNRGAERLFGYSAAEAIGRPITMIIPADHRGEEPQIIARIRAGERVEHYETVRRRKDGGLVDISLTVSPVRDGRGKIVGASKIARDIGERRRAAEALARRMQELTALYQLTDRLHRAEKVDAVYDAALDAIYGALRAERAAILLCDEAGVMRFVAWRGLSQAYREAVEGHSPWSSDSRDAQPIAIDDVAVADLPRSLKSTVAAEGIGALAFIPIAAGGRLIGKFMVYYPAPYAFSAADLDLAVTIARQLAFGLARIRAEAARRQAEEELRRNEERERARAAELETIMEAVPALIWIARDPDCRVITGNRMAAELLRLPLATNPSLSAPAGERPSHFDVLAGTRLLAPDELPVQRAARGEEVRNFEEEVRFADGTSLHLLGNARPLRGVDGKPSGAVAAFVDITDRKRAEDERKLLVAELSHRVKNTLATVISISHQSFSRTSDVESARLSFDARIRALAQTHSRLAEANWSGVAIETMLLDELAPYRRDDGGNLALSGPRVTFNPRCALTLGMAIHELATNAAKYGALSTPAGRIDVSWQVDSEAQQLAILWIESGGPAVVPPKHSGFGRLLLERVLGSDLRSTVALDFAPSGLRCAIALALDENVTRAA